MSTTASSSSYTAATPLQALVADLRWHLDIPATVNMDDAIRKACEDQGLQYSGNPRNKALDAARCCANITEQGNWAWATLNEVQREQEAATLVSLATCCNNQSWRAQNRADASAVAAEARVMVQRLNCKYAARWRKQRSPFPSRKVLLLSNQLKPAQQWCQFVWLRGGISDNVMNHCLAQGLSYVLDGFARTRQKFWWLRGVIAMDYVYFKAARNQYARQHSPPRQQAREQPEAADGNSSRDVTPLAALHALRQIVWEETQPTQRPVSVGQATFNQTPTNAYPASVSTSMPRSGPRGTVPQTSVQPVLAPSTGCGMRLGSPASLREVSSTSPEFEQVQALLNDPERRIDKNREEYKAQIKAMENNAGSKKWLRRFRSLEVWKHTCSQQRIAGGMFPLVRLYAVNGGCGFPPAIDDTCQNVVHMFHGASRRAQAIHHNQGACGSILRDLDCPFPCLPPRKEGDTMKLFGNGHYFSNGLEYPLLGKFCKPKSLKHQQLCEVAICAVQLGSKRFIHSADNKSLEQEGGNGQQFPTLDEGSYDKVLKERASSITFNTMGQDCAVLPASGGPAMATVQYVAYFKDVTAVRGVAGNTHNFPCPGPDYCPVCLAIQQQLEGCPSG